MDNVELRQIQGFIMNGALTTMEAKGKDYATDGDRLSNFKVAANWAGKGDQTDICFVYMMKQVIAVRTAVQKRELKGESLPDKLRDIINYAVLLAANIQETNPEMMVDDEGRRPF